ncbi:HTH-type transcriptional activator tipA [Actinomyces bovis]|uniref:HTH-type transcriptional activator tipA n=1 Tax=Actinomyces bovis TaxID=1658 RepID=A0ABY1VQR9_9ACTO|nr:HTH-type transcriptional activator tipA [Actinomyces bovis]VEG56105.1 HTH-type transcriptional activator tipA [Actinomyces israelii]
MERDSDADGQSLTVGQVAALVGVSVRTLHHWDEIGLVTPSERSWAGYRLYTSADVERVHQVLVYRETGMPLAQVAEVLDQPGVDAFGHLSRQRELLTERIAHLTRMLRAVDTMMEKDTMGEKLSAAQRAQIMGDQWDPAWEAEAQERWGHTEDWKVSAERLAAKTPAESKADKERVEAVERELAAAMAAGVKPGSERANALAEEHRASLSWFDVTHAKHVLLARGYVCDPRFKQHYDAVAPGLAQWLKAVVEANAAAKGVDPETATWQ